MDFIKMEEESKEYASLKSRIRKTMHQGKKMKLDRPSLAMTEFAVDYLRELAPRELGSIDMYWASSLCRESYVSPCTLMVALMYARRLKLKDSIYLDTVSSSDLFLVSMMVASKFLVEVDETTLEEWIKASNLEADDIYDLERGFLKAIDWNLFVGKDEFGFFLHQLEQRIAWRQYLSRNEKFFTYTDLRVLSESKEGHIWPSIIKLSQDITKVILACTASYIAGLSVIASLSYFLLSATPSSYIGSSTQSLLPRNNFHLPVISSAKEQPVPFDDISTAGVKSLLSDFSNENSTALAVFECVVDASDPVRLTKCITLGRTVTSVDVSVSPRTKNKNLSINDEEHKVDSPPPVPCYTEGTINLTFVRSWIALLMF